MLYIAAHENPLYISQRQGHNETHLLFEVYARYAANASRRDGSAFDTLKQNEGVA